MTEWQSFFERFTYKPHFQFMYQKPSTIGPIDESVTIVMTVPDSRLSNDHRRIHHSLVRVQKVIHLPEYWVNDQYACDYIMACLKDLETHEQREWARLDGKLISDPHKDDQ